MPHLEIDPRWSSPDDMATEYEVSDFAWALVRMLKPLVCVETGTYMGHTTAQIASALKQNGEGILHSCDLDARRIEGAKAYCGNLPVEFHHSTGEEMLQHIDNVEFAFIDSGEDAIRYAEARMLRLAPQAWVMIHDSRRAHNALIRENIGWQGMDFPTPRGVTLFKIPH